jgi:CHAT domain-containing protein
MAIPGGLMLASAQGTSVPAARTRLEEAGALLAAGSVARANEALTALLREGPLSEGDRALAQSLLSVAHAAGGEMAESDRLAREAVRAARSQSSARTRAAIAANAGLAISEAGDAVAARAALQSAAADAADAGDNAIAAIALVNLALVEARTGGEPAAAASRARQAVDAMPDAARRAPLYASLGLALLPEGGGRAGPADRLANELLALSYRDASSAASPRDMAVALGLSGELRLVRGEPSAAIPALERAVALAQAAGEDPWLFRWFWKRGAGKAANGDREGARRDLEKAVAELDAARTRRALGRFSAASLARNYRGAYLDLADLLLAGDAPGGEDRLRQARDVLERSRASEVEDYFRDPCVTSSARRTAEIDTVDPTVAVIYPVSFASRTDILVGHRSGLVRFTAPVGATAVAREVQRLRAALERPGDARYLPAAQRLNGWLVAPVAEHLRKLGVKTVVWVPDGAMRGLPFASLHDGERHLVESYAVAVTPVTSAVEAKPLPAPSRRALLTGLTESRQGFDALPAVARELDALSSLLKAPVLRDSAFTVSALREALERAPANIIHVASHGQFAPEATQSFLLAYDGRFTLPQLRAALASAKLREEPVELLTLSACQTAAGDERAALGLAGVAISAGARSALATLWSVNDESTAALVTDFYWRLVETGSSKAEALRGAQIALLRGNAFSHPAFWAPFLLIGNWM